MSIHSTLHGYRIQFLYTLYRMVSSENPQEEFVPEGREDLDIYADGMLVECIQVKCRKDKITYSDLYSSGKNTSLYSRAIQSLHENANAKIKLVAVGGVISEEIVDRSRLKRKLKDDQKLKLNGYQAKNLANSIEPEVLEEQYIISFVKDELKKKFVEIDTETGIKLLTEWISETAERKERLTLTDLEKEILAIRNFQAKEQSFQNQYGTAIVPLFLERNLDDFNIENISQSFYDGVSARPEHIIGGFDVNRDRAEKSVEVSFRKSNIVIIYGISGAGKSTFAYRYIYEHGSTMAYEIKNCNATNINEIVTSLQSMAKGLRISSMFYFDVDPSNPEWIEAISIFAGLENVRCLVTMRQEDWNIQKARIQSKFNSENVLLDLNEEEASLVYQKLNEKGFCLQLSFIDAWEMLGDSGNLLEFVYSLTHGESLESRVKFQIDSEPNDNKQILGVIAIANYLGAKLDVTNLKRLSNKDSVVLSSSIEKMEHEYFRIENNVFDNIHPIRTMFIVKALLGNNPTLLKEMAMDIFNNIDLSNGHFYLLRMMKVCNMNPQDLIREFNDKTLTSVQCYSVAKALLWCGINEYEKTHENLIRELENIAGPLWEYLVPMNFTEIDLLESVRGLMELLPDFPDTSDITSRFANQKDIFIHLEHWCQSREFHFAPITHKDWYYLSRFLIITLFVKSTSINITGNPLPMTIPNEKLEECAYVLLGLKTVRYYNGVAEYEEKFVERLRIDFNILRFEKKGSELWMKSFMTYYDDKSGGNNQEGFLTEQLNVSIIDLCRCAFPEIKKYHSEIMEDGLLNVFPSIPTGKHISRENIPLEEMLEPRRLLCNLFKKAGVVRNRAEYAKLALKKRHDYVNAATITMRFLDEWHKKSKKAVKGYEELMYQIQKCIIGTNLTSPVSEISEFGYHLINKEEIATVDVLFESRERGIFLQIDSFFSKLHNFFVQFSRALLNEGNFKTTASANLYEALSQLPQLQNVFKTDFSKYIDYKELENFESLERKALSSLWVVWESLRDNFCYSNYTTLAKRYEQMRISLIKKIHEFISTEWLLQGYEGRELNVAVEDNYIEITYLYQSENDYNEKFSCIQIAIAKKIANYDYFSSQRLILESTISKLVVRPLYRYRNSACLNLDGIQFLCTLTGIFEKANDVIEGKDSFFFVPEINGSSNIPTKVEAFNTLMNSLNTIIVMTNKLNELKREVIVTDVTAQKVIENYEISCKKIIRTIDISKMSELISAINDNTIEKTLIMKAANSIRAILPYSSSDLMCPLYIRSIKETLDALTPLKMRIQIHLANLECKKF